MNNATQDAGFDTSSWTTLRWTRGTRYYRVHLEQDLWSSWVITSVNGRSGTRLGRARCKPAFTIEAAPIGPRPHCSTPAATWLRIDALDY
jgi:hypothetical protein